MLGPAPLRTRSLQRPNHMLGHDLRYPLRTLARTPRFTFLEAVLQDLRYGTRMLSRNAGFTAVGVLALALGIGVNTTVFTAYKAMVARPLDARDAGRMVNLALTRHSGASDFAFSYPDYKAYRDSLHSFSGLIAFTPDRMTLSNASGMVSQRSSDESSLFGRLGLLPAGARNAEFARVYIVSENYFRVLGAAPIRGHSFESISVPGLVASPSVLIGENYWQKRFAGDPAVLGKTIRLNGAAVTIIGITPHDFIGTDIGVPDFWLPISLEPLVHPGRNWLVDRENECCRLCGRLAAGVSIGQAQSEMNLLADRLRMQHDPRSESSKPATALVWPGSPFPLPIDRYGGLKLAILLIMAAAGMVLAVACANVGSLQLARARSRQNELGIRMSLGASRLRMIGQLLTESALLGLLAGVVALLFTWGFTRLLAVKFAEAAPAGAGTLVFHVTPGFGALVYVLAISLAAGGLFGLLPALESSRSALISAFKGKAGTPTVRSRRLQDILVALQVAVSLVLLISGSMFTHSAIRSLKMETGYDSKHVIDLDLQFPEGAKYNDARKAALIGELRSRLAVLPGVEAITSARPPNTFGFRTAAGPLNPERSPARSVQSILYSSHVQANYFETLGIPVFLGRGFPSRAAQGERSVILSESAAKQLWPGESPIGRSLRLAAGGDRLHQPGEPPGSALVYQVIGVARDTRGVEFDGSDSRQVYLPLPEDWIRTYPILIRTHSDPGPVIRSLDTVLSSVDPDVVATSATLDEMLRQTGPFIASSLAAIVASAVGLFGLVLAVMGIYGTVSFIVVLRTREIGIRMAVGAQEGNILGLILRESARPVLAGLLAGLFLSVGVSHLLRSLFYGVDTIDGISFAGVSLLFLTIALLAAYPPSRQAMRVDPMVALRYE
jgi:predicted permease